VKSVVQQIKEEAKDACARQQIGIGLPFSNKVNKNSMEKEDNNEINKTIN
jgi:hypothetical protein